MMRKGVVEKEFFKPFKTLTVRALSHIKLSAVAL
jgi:hypothetical protein